VTDGVRPLAIALDVDGTVLRRDRSVSPRLKAVLGRLKAAGHLPFLATGRRRKTALVVAQMLGLDDMPLVVADGAAAFRRARDPAPCLAVPLPKEAIEAALRLARELPAGLVLYDWDDLWSRRATSWRWIGRTFGRPLSLSLGALRLAWADLRHRPRPLDPERLPAMPLVKGAFVGAGPMVRERLDGLVHFTMPAGHGEEFVAPGVSKATGVEAVLRAYGLGWEDVIAFGDNYNDLPLLSRAGRGYAMANAPPGVRQLVPYHADSADDDGVAKILERFA
jgi:HAD superfamily hydrolase (TIGR01484 family)